MSAVVFHTPGLIPIEAFTTFGINAKPNTTNPIGYFGTGLKYAIAVLCRLGATPVLFIGRDEYMFYVKATKFRDKEFGMVRMKRKRWSLTKATHHALPFTTELGKTWLAWQAFRELESNTRDEGGTTKLIEDAWRDLGVHHNEPNQTTLIVEHPEFTQAFNDRDGIFLPGALLIRGAASDARVQVIEKPSKALYFRGLRVAETRKPALFTYNFVTNIDLTEDRTIKHDFMVRTELARHVVTSTDKKFIESVVTAPDDKWEHGLEFEYQNEAPSDVFREVIDRRKGAVSRSALRYMGGWTDSSSYARPAGTFELYPRPWLADQMYAVDASGTVVLSTSTNHQLMVDVVDAVNAMDEQEASPPLPDTTITTVDENLIPF